MYVDLFNFSRFWIADISTHQKNFYGFRSFYVFNRTFSPSFPNLVVPPIHLSFLFVTGKNAPYYGIQFHPEKTIFEWAEKVSIPHTPETIRFAQHLVDNFVDETRSNKHRFESSEEERQYTISRKEPLYTGYLTNSHSPFVQIYVFWALFSGGYLRNIFLSALPLNSSRQTKTSLFTKVTYWLKE